MWRKWHEFSVQTDPRSRPRSRFNPQHLLLGAPPSLALGDKASSVLSAVLLLEHGEWGHHLQFSFLDHSLKRP